MYLAQSLLILLKQLVIDLEQANPVDKTIGDDGIPSNFGVKLSQAALFQQILRFVQSDFQSETQANQTVAGWCASPRKNLMQINFAHARLFGQLGFGDIFLRKNSVQNLGDAFSNKLLLIIREKSTQILGIHQLQLQVIGVLLFQLITAFTKWKAPHII